MCTVSALDAGCRHSTSCQSDVQVPRQAALEVSFQRDQSSPLPDSFASSTFWDLSDKCAGLL
jgi:hypothetical protein